MGSKIHALMYPWFATGHITPFIHLSNKLAEKGHKITFLLPKKALKHFEHLNMYPQNIAFLSINVPHVDGLPVGTETASEIPVSSSHLLMLAMDLTRTDVENVVRTVGPDLIFFDFAHWIPQVGKELGVKTVKYLLLSAAAAASLVVQGGDGGELGLAALSKVITLREKDAYSWKPISNSMEQVDAFRERIATSFTQCDAVLIRACKVLEEAFCNYVESKVKKEIIFAGPMLVEQDKSVPLEEHWSKWLHRYEPDTVVFCALDSQTVMEKDQFQELCLGMELTGLPFIIAVKPPRGAKTVQEALPKGFEERVKGHGVVWGGWVQQKHILSHPCVGCFVSHCGLGSMWESLASDCQIVLVPQIVEQVINTRFMSEELEVSVEVEREANGWFSKESLRDAINSVMQRDNELADRVRKNHTKWREIVTSTSLMNGYVDKFVKSLQDLISHP